MTEDQNINNMALYDEPVTYNPTAELNPSSKIPQGWYLMELSLRKEPNLKAIGGQPCVEVNVQGTIIAPGEKLNGFRVTDYVSTYVFESSGTGVLQTLLKAVGHPIPATQSPRQTGAFIEQAFETPLQARAYVRWEASVKDSDGTSYKRLRGMRNFPLNADGSYDPNTTFVLSDGSTVTAEAKEKFSDFKPQPATQAAG